MEKLNGYRIAGFVLGLLSVISGGLILAILGLIFSIKCKKQLSVENKKDGLVTAGFILSIIGIVKSFFTAIFVFFFILISLFSATESSSRPYRDYPYHNRYSYYEDYDYDYDDYYDDFFSRR